MKPEVLQAVAHAVSQEGSLDVVLKRIVEGLAQRGGIALARVWLKRTAGEACELCTDEERRPHRLHMIASAGRPISPANLHQDWTRTDGEFHRGGIRVAKIAADSTPVLIKSLKNDPLWLGRPDFTQQERVQSFAGYPLTFRGELQGVLGVFSRSTMDETGFRWLEIFADAAAVAIANARAFDEIDKLRQRLESENAYLQEEVRAAAGSSRILGNSASMQHLLERIEMVAPTDAPVLIFGETGAGKELVARAIHERSTRADRPLVKINCTAIPGELFESEFFGHIKGAFSGALKDRIGRFQLADGGTLFLDEIGSLPLEMQPKLLRVLQDGEFEPVGHDGTRHVNVRTIAATNRNPKRRVREGLFREDLFYRLSVFPIEVPPLREHKDDISMLAAHFLDSACKRFSRSGLQLTPNQLSQLQHYDWPGNVRELENVIERAVITSRLGSLNLDIAGAEPAPSTAAVNGTASHEEPEIVLDEEMNRRARDNTAAALKRSGGRIYGPGGAAELLGVKPSTLTTRIRKLGLK